ncbi:MAG: transcriptional repressor [Prevotellaceae bacterium]|jgi:Fur family ferric uptake transcriptional regulator|nr:transcriptional repressor [Prevotellaceae bacterium]
MKEELPFDEIKNIFTQYLIANKHRKTFERYAILEQAYQLDEHFNAESLYSMMKEEHRVSLATVYNTLELLIDAQLIVKHQFGRQEAQYEKTFGNKIHNHLVCTNCGKIKEFSDKAIRSAIQAKEFPDFRKTHYSLYVYGLCKKCLNKLNNHRK